MCMQPRRGWNLWYRLCCHRRLCLREVNNRLGPIIDTALPAPPSLSVTKPVANIRTVFIKSSLALSIAYCVLLMWSSFLISFFMALRMPPLQLPPKLMQATKTTEAIFQLHGMPVLAPLTSSEAIDVARGLGESEMASDATVTSLPSSKVAAAMADVVMWARDG